MYCIVERRIPVGLAHLLIAGKGSSSSSRPRTFVKEDERERVCLPFLLYEIMEIDLLIKLELGAGMYYGKGSEGELLIHRTYYRIITLSIGGYSNSYI